MTLHENMLRLNRTKDQIQNKRQSLGKLIKQTSRQIDEQAEKIEESDLTSDDEGIEYTFVQMTDICGKSIFLIR